MKKPTIYEIRHRTTRNQPHFFDRETLKFFGQTMSSFSVEKTEEEEVFYVSAPSFMVDHRTAKKEFVNRTERWFWKDNLYFSLEEAIKAKKGI